MDHLKQLLEDERCGLFILAGLDQSSGGRDVLTIHAAQDALSPESRAFIESSVSALSPETAIRFRVHSSGDLHTPDSLEGFAGLFRHDHIVCDPTGAFARVSKLLLLARRIRSDFGPDVRSVFWQPHASALVVVATDGPGSAISTAAIQAVIDGFGCEDLKKTIRSVSTGSVMPAGRYTPVDALSRTAPKAVTRLAGLVARISGIAALVGLGTLTAAHAKTPPADIEENTMMPGIIALVDLTTLGENARGGRNHFQAVGGLRLYFGASHMLRAAAFRPGGHADTIFTVPDDLDDEDEADGGADPTVIMPQHIAYGF